MNEANRTTERERVSRAALDKIRELLLEPLRTNPPMIGTYPREIDIELFRLFNHNDIPVVRRERLLTLGGRQVGRKREEWVYETHGIDATWFDENGVFHSEYLQSGDVQEDGSFLPIPMLTEVPHYTSVTDDAITLKDHILGQGRRLLIEEVEAEPISRWTAKIADASNQIVAEGETYDCAASIVLAVLSDLTTNHGASWWIEVVSDDENRN
jgi:hypothetical protein